MLDLEAYLNRIGYRGPLAPTVATLEALHLAHATHIPFENLDVLRKQPVRIDLASLQGKLVAGRRGGYCYEHNLLLSAVLQRVGYSVRHLAARVLYRNRRTALRTHMLLLVEAGGDTWLADVGFGAEGLLLPIPIGGSRPSQQFLWTYRVAEADGERVLQSLRGGSWNDLYSFLPQSVSPADIEAANAYVSTHPDSPFAHTLTAQLQATNVRHVLRNRKLTLDRGETVETRIFGSDDEVLRALADTFGLRLPDGIPLPRHDP